MDQMLSLPDKGAMSDNTRTDKDLIARVGQRLAAARLARGLTQAQLAEAAAVEPATLSRWETGASSPSLTSIVRVAGVLGVPPGSLLDDREPASVVEFIASDGLSKLTSHQRDLVLDLIRELTGQR